MNIHEEITWSDVPAEQALDGITRQWVSGETFTIVRYTYQQGSDINVGGPVPARPLFDFRLD